MKKRCILFSCVIFLLFNISSSAQCGQNLLNNPGFEDPVQTNVGNNITGLFTINGWTMTGNVLNIVRTDGSAYVSGPDNAQEGTQYIDVTAANGTAYQDFTITGPAFPAIFGGYFSSRENENYINWTASIEIYSLPSHTLISTSTTRAFTSAEGFYPQQEAWHLVYGFAMLSAGNYRYQVNLGDYGNFDAAYLSPDCILPLKLNSFNGEYLNNVVKLNWKAEKQTGFSHFEIEKSTNARNFTEIKKILPSNGLLYTFSDPDITAGTIYYRLKMIDYNGKISYSKIIRIHTKAAFQFQVGPNPASDHLAISGLGKHGSIRIVDLSGRTLLKKEVRTQAILIDASFLQKGMYLLEYFDGIQNQTRKILKQ